MEYDGVKSFLKGEWLMRWSVGNPTGEKMVVHVCGTLTDFPPCGSAQQVNVLCSRSQRPDVWQMG
ncbi:MAG: hypothetical protein MJY45_05845 [Bacteroidales bacterium]|nr:hypothetical protein [Bacteroidales bacterium]